MGVLVNESSGNMAELELNLMVSFEKILVNVSDGVRGD